MREQYCLVVLAVVLFCGRMQPWPHENFLTSRKLFWRAPWAVGSPVLTVALVNLVTKLLLQVYVFMGLLHEKLFAKKGLP